MDGTQTPEIPVHQTTTETGAKKTVLHTLTAGNFFGHDYTETFLFDNANAHISPATYHLDTGPLLRVEHGIGNIINPSPEFIATNLARLSQEGWNTAVSPTGRPTAPTYITSSQIYDYDPNTYTIKILQYRLSPATATQSVYPYANFTGARVNAEYYTHTPGNRIDHTKTWSGKDEIEELVWARWIPKKGIVVFPSVVGGKTFTEELQYAKEVLSDAQKTSQLRKFLLRSKTRAIQQQKLMIAGSRSRHLAYSPKTPDVAA